LHKSYYSILIVFFSFFWTNCSFAHSSKLYDQLFREGNYKTLYDSIELAIKGDKNMPANDFINNTLLQIQCLQILGDFGMAEVKLNKVFPIIKDRYQDFNYERDYYLYKGYNSRKLMQLEAAEMFYKKALAIDKKRNLKLNFITDYRYLSDLALTKDEFDKAKEYANKGLYWTKIVHTANQDSIAIINLYNLLGAVYYLTSNIDSSKYYYHLAFTTAKKYLKYGNPTFSRIYFNIGLIHESRGYHEKAKNYYLVALKNLQFHKIDYPLFSEIYGALGYTELMLKNYQNAIYYFNKDLATTKKFFGKNHSELSWGYENLGLVYTKMNDFDAAEANLNKALQIRKNFLGTNHHNISFLYSDFADLYLRKNNPEKAYSYLTKALEIENKIDKNILSNRKADILLEIAKTLKSIDPEMAKQSAEFAIEIYSKLSKNKQKSIVVANTILAEINLNKGNYKSSLGFINKALGDCSISENKLLKMNIQSLDSILFDEEYLEALIIKGRLLIRLYDLSQNKILINYALKHFKTTTLVLNKLRNSYAYDDVKLDLIAKYKICNEEGIKCAYQMYKSTNDYQYMEDAFYFAENNKATLLLNQETKNNLLYKNKAANSTLTKTKDISKEINYYRNELAKQELNSSKSRDSLQLLLANSIKKQRKIQKELEQKIPEFYHLRFGEKKITLRKIQSKLNNNTQLLHYTYTSEYLYVFFIENNKIIFKKLKNDSFMPNIILLKNAFLNNDPIKVYEYSNFLPKELVPLQGKKISKRIIINDPEIAEVPFEYIQFLYSKKLIPTIYNVSATLYFKNKKQKNIFQNELAAIAPVKFNKSWKDLPNTINEVASITKYYNSKHYTYQNANKSAVLEALQKYKILHIATHAYVDTINPLSSYFQLYSPDSISPDSSKLYLYQLYGTPSSTKLAVLSTCNSGAGKINSGEGIESMAQAFNQNNCPNLLMSMWSANDESTTWIMDKFYMNLKKHKQPYQALFEAKSEYLKNVGRIGTNPYYWDSFIAYGNSESNYFSRPLLSIFWFVPIFVLLIVFVLMGYIKKRVLIA
jgi:tetratricopeptide (TPR) repeat protein